MIGSRLAGTCVALAMLALGGCVPKGYTFQNYEPLSESAYRLDRMAFQTSGGFVDNTEKVCSVDIFSRFYPQQGKLAACGKVVDHCKSLGSDRLTRQWFENATLHLGGNEIASAAFYTLNPETPAANSANCVVTEKPWDDKYLHAKPYFKGGYVWTRIEG